MIDLNLVKYCAEECERQRSGEKSVYNMIAAWEMVSAAYSKENITLLRIDAIGNIVDPIKNAAGFRKIQIFVGNVNFGYTEKAPSDQIESRLTAVIEAYYDGRLDPTHPEAKTPEDQFYYEFEEIHPFRDGNGRTGKILYNLLCDTMNHPILPPNFWGTENL